MNEYIKCSGHLFADDGGELGRYSISYPQFIGEQESIKKINEFYTTLAAKCESFCKGDLRGFCERDLREGDHYKPYSYRLSCAVSFEDEECVSVIVSASLKRIGEMGFIGEYTSAQVFSRSDGLLLPPTLILKKYAPEIKNPKKYARKNKISSRCLTERGVAIWRDKRWIELQNIG